MRCIGGRIFVLANKRSLWYYIVIFSLLIQKGVSVMSFPYRLYPLESQNINRIIDAGNGYFYFGTEERRLGLMNFRGKNIISPEWNAVHLYYDDGVILCKKGSVSVLFDLSGNTLTGIPLDRLLSSGAGVTALSSGGSCIMLEQIGDFHEGMSRARSRSADGFVDAHGHFIPNPHYPALLTGGNFYNGLAIIGKKGGFFRKNVYGFMDKKGTLVVAPTFDNINSFSEGFAAVHTKNGWKVLKTDGSFLDTFEIKNGKRQSIDTFYYIGDFCNGYAPVVHLEPSRLLPGGDGTYLTVGGSGGWGLIDKNGKLTIDATHSRISAPTPNGICIFSEVFENSDEEAFGLINTSGDILFPCSASSIEVRRNDFFVFERDGKFGVVDNFGVLVTDAAWDKIGRLTGDTVSVCKDGLWGLLDRSGALILPVKYQSEFGLCGGIGIAAVDSEYHIIHRSGKQIGTESFSDESPLDFGLSLVKKDDTIYLLDYGYQPKPL